MQELSRGTCMLERGQLQIDGIIYIHIYIYIYISTISMAAPQNIGLGSGFSHGHHGRHGRHGHHGQDQMLQMLKSPSMEVLSIQSRRGSGACCCGALRG